MKIPAKLFLPLISQGIGLALDAIRLRMEAEGRTEITLADIEACKLEDPEEVIKKYRESRGL